MSTPTPVMPDHPRLRPLGIHEVTLDPGFWGDRQQLNAEEIIPHVEHWLERLGWAGNFDLAVTGGLPEGRSGREFADSEVYKLLEGMAWELGRRPNPEMEERFARLSRRVASAQEADGYLSTAFGRPGQRPRYSDLEWGHELYCYGHLIQAGVARLRTYGEDLLVRTAVAAADHVCREFGDEGDTRVCGHPEIETALAELARATGRPKYLQQAKKFVERRGHGNLGKIFLGQEYFQDDTPVRAAEILRGHAVRALYLSAGAVDVAMDTDDDGLLTAAAQQVRRTLARRTYITGGMGAQHEGESFGADFALPPDRSYSETCAGIASVQLNHRLLLATGDPLHADAVERTLFNVVAAAVAEDGHSFFYTNTLHQREAGRRPPAGEASPRAASGMRAPWFDVSCCPTNLTRTLASLAAYVATADDQGLQIHQYAQGTITTELHGEPLRLLVETDYPHHGNIQVRVEQAPQAWTLSMRIPSWADGARAWITGEAPQMVEPGMFELPRPLRAGETVTLDLPVAPRWSWADPRVDAVRGHVAVECGPLVMALESPDVAAAAPDAVEAADADVATVRADPRHPLTLTEGQVMLPVRRHRNSESQWPFPARRPQEPDDETPLAHVPMIPYHRRANRGPSTMRVWIPEVPAAIQ
ncbi:glycoside hydrolase family 127 protein [Nesterenkonia xinjiangensis]|uniref:Glycoside hydrolase family 127 protein n=1 Tax=Nesterenkonia xinjiangensis TaxID=225327 RepID=A0A7Z0GK97_9MICC|nr:beta-L-arabinofuranosidase domain-containing protein [Nesterenkonia xinjiangensis]NYJ76974.1 hypothetical protein [Nesterenkonia xinjiangensis]